MTRVLALDLATNSGWAVVDKTGVVECGSWDLLAGVRTTGKAAPPLDVRHVLAVQSLRALVLAQAEYHRVDLVAVERDFGRGSGTRLLVSLYTAAQEAAYRASLPCLGIRLGDWRKHVHGSAGKSTEFYKSEAMRLVPQAEDADAAEAALIGNYVIATVRFAPSAPIKGIAA